MKMLDGNIVSIEDGYGVITVSGDVNQSKLLLEFAPMLTQEWCDGSAGRLAVQVPKSWHRRPGFDRWMTLRELFQVRNWLADPPAGADPTAGLAPLLQLLAPGEYQVDMEELPSLHDEPRENLFGGLAFVGGFIRTDRGLPVVKIVEIHNQRGWWYSWDERIELVPTDQWPPRDNDTVRQYRHRVRDGVRPAVVLLRPPGEGPAYVIDGHHKLAAYVAEGIPPTVIDIRRL
jgi:hypothetical protein